MYFVNASPVLCSASVTEELYALSYFIAPRYNGTALYWNVMDVHDAYLNMQASNKNSLFKKLTIHFNIWTRF